MEKLVQERYNLIKVEYENLQNFTRLCHHKKQETSIILKWQSTQDFFTFNNQNEEIKLKINEVQNVRDAYLKSIRRKNYHD